MPAGQPVFYYVDPTEEIAGVLRGIKLANSPKVAVVLPKEARLFRNDVNLRLMAAYARQGEKEIALVTTDRGVARIAEAHGLSVYTSTDLAWQPEGRVICNEFTEPQLAVGTKWLNSGASTRTRQKSSWRQRVIAVACALFAALALFYAFMPRVTVVVTPSLRTLERQLELALVAEGASGEGVVLHTAEAQLSATGSVPVTGRRTEGVGVAAGAVLFFNESNRQAHLPKGTVVSTDGGQLYMTTKAVDIAPVKAEYFMDVPVGMKAGQAEAPVRADKPGAGGNVAAGRLKTLPNGPAGIKVVNPEPTRGGTDRSVTFVTTSDIDAAQKQAKSRMFEQAGKAVTASIGADVYIFSSMLEVTEVQVTATPAINKEAKTVTVSLNGFAHAPYVLLKDVRKSVAAQADALVPAGYQRMGTPVVASISPTAPASSSQTPDSLSVTAGIPVGSTVDPAAIAAMLAGMTPAQATQTLVESGEVGEVAVQGKPRKRLPRWTPWIRVVVANPVDLVSK